MMPIIQLFTIPFLFQTEHAKNPVLDGKLCSQYADVCIQ